MDATEMQDHIESTFDVADEIWQYTIDDEKYCRDENERRELLDYENGEGECMYCKCVRYAKLRWPGWTVETYAQEGAEERRLYLDQIIRDHQQNKAVEEVYAQFVATGQAYQTDAPDSWGGEMYEVRGTIGSEIVLVQWHFDDNELCTEPDELPWDASHVIDIRNYDSGEVIVTRGYLS